MLEGNNNYDINMKGKIMCSTSVRKFVPPLPSANVSIKLLYDKIIESDLFSSYFIAKRHVFVHLQTNFERSSSHDLNLELVRTASLTRLTDAPYTSIRTPSPSSD